MRTQIRDLFSANFDLRAAADSIIHKTSNSFDCRRCNQRTMGGLLIKPIANLESAGGILETSDELGVNALLDKDSVGTHACLS